MARTTEIRPTVMPTTATQAPVIEYLEWLTERAIRVGPWSFGLDGILGLVPGLGDLISGLISAYIVACAARDGVPRAAVARMITNVAIDTALGSIPIAGDVFDFLYKSNTKNLQIYRDSLYGRRRQSARDWGFVILFIVIALAILAVPIAIAVAVLSQLTRA
jgi:uncharacterized protein DUF4112